MGVTYTLNVAKTYEVIQTYTSSGSTSTFDFTSIPSTYTDLFLVYNGTFTGSTNGGIRLRFNNDLGSSYDITRVYSAQSGAVQSDNSNNTSFIDIGYMIAGTIETFQCNINNYASTNTYKTIVSHFASPANDGTMQQAGTWRNTDAINRVTLSSDHNHISGSMATLYGIKRA
jgi:hypothetical protein